MTEMNVRSGAYCSFASAFCLIIALILNACINFGAFGDPVHTDINDPYNETDLKSKWEFNRKIFPAYQAATFFYAIGLLILLQGITCLRKIYGEQENMASKSIYYCFLIGIILPSLQFLQNIGTQKMAGWISDPNSDWKINAKDLISLDVSYEISQAQSIWLTSMFFIFFAVGFVIAFYLDTKYKLGYGFRSHSIFGLVNSVLGVITFGLSIGAFFHDAIGVPYGAFSFIFGVTFISWVFWLGIILLRVGKK
eukprot:TRINITY_DN4414_c0_g1_i1.p1 TRINITY_DN4414_c0_g1~~TRINITY_DN4414_c0_g1_i1.p1  ORF type:complete len:252 (-),score=52.40 TRINITY_DN4414_c0_g1_i1:20-775(-)